VRASVAVADDLWLLGDDGRAVYRFDTSVPAPVARVAVLERAPTTFRAPVDLVGDEQAVFALVPTRTEPDRHDAVVVRIDATTDEVTGSLQLPSSLFAGALALTH
jgi:hypothetical protein